MSDFHPIGMPLIGSTWALELSPYRSQFARPVATQSWNASDRCR